MDSSFIKKIKFNNVGPFVDEQNVVFAPFTLIFGKNSAGKSYLLRIVKAVTKPFKILDQFKKIDRISPNNLHGRDPMKIEWDIPMDGEENKNLSFKLSLNHHEEHIQTETIRKRGNDEDTYTKVDKLEDVESLLENMDRVVITFPDNDENRIDTISVFPEENSIAVKFRFTAIKNELSKINKDWKEIFSNIKVTIQDDFLMFHTINMKPVLLSAMIPNKNLNEHKNDSIFVNELGQEIIDGVRCINNSIDRLNEQFQYINASRLQPKPIYDFSEFIEAYPRLWDMIPGNGEALLNAEMDNSFEVNEISFSIKEKVGEDAYIYKIKDSVEKKERIFEFQDDLWNNVNVSGEEILSWENASQWYNTVLFLLTKLGYPEYDVIFDILEFENEEKKVKISIRKSNDRTRHSLDTVGYGISQIIPVLFGVALKKGRLIIEEPEIHLHPSAQLNFIRALVELDRENIRPFHYVLETHSEVMIRGLQTEISKSKEKGFNKKFSIIYLTQDENAESKLQQVRIKQNGFFKDEWPEDYFSINYDLSRELWK